METASDLGFSFVADWPYSKPEVEILTSASAAVGLNADVFFLLREEWNFGPFIFNEIDDGVRKGTFAIQPRVNFCCIELYAPSERKGVRPRRLAPGSIVLRDRPISGDTYIEGNAVTSVREGYDSFLEALFAAFAFLRIGTEKVLVSKSNISALQRGEIFPAFDYQDCFFAKPATSLK